MKITTQLKDVAVVLTYTVAVAWLVGRLFEYLRHTAKARALGCKPAPLGLDSRDPTGLIITVKSLRAMKRFEHPAWMIKRMDYLGEQLGRTATTITVSQPFFKKNIFTTEPENLKAILATQFKDFEFGVGRTDNFWPLLGQGIFASNGERWMRSRAMLRLQFMRSLVSRLDLEERHLQHLMRVLDTKAAGDGWTSLVDLKALFFRLTLDSATELLLGESTNSQLITAESQEKEQEGRAFVAAFDAAQQTLAVGARLGHNYRLVHTSAFRRNVQMAHDFVNHFVVKALAKTADAKVEEDVHLDDKQAATEKRYIFLDELTKETRDPVELRSHVLNVLLAGRDTTASVLSWFFYTMAQKDQADRYQKLRRLIIDAFGTYADPRDITFESLKACQYLQWCISETLRLYTPVSVNLRTAVVDTTLPTGGGKEGKSPVYVKKGMDCVFSTHVMHTRKDLWGEDAREFVPERWETKRAGWEYLPFLGGPRVCIGQQFALTEIAYVIVRIVQRVDVMDGKASGPLKQSLTLTNSPGAGVNVRLHFVE